MKVHQTIVLPPYSIMDKQSLLDVFNLFLLVSIIIIIISILMLCYNCLAGACSNDDDNCEETSNASQTIREVPLHEIDLTDNNYTTSNVTKNDLVIVVDPTNSNQIWVGTRN